MAPPGQDRSGQWSEADDDEQDRARHGIVGEGRAGERRHRERKDSRHGVPAAAPLRRRAPRWPGKTSRAMAILAVGVSGSRGVMDIGRHAFAAAPS